MILLPCVTLILFTWLPKLLMSSPLTSSSSSSSSSPSPLPSSSSMIKTTTTGTSSSCNNVKWGIQKLIVPELVENGSTESIVLDCVYCLQKSDNYRIVVKWFHNDDPQPIYQWIPELNSRHASKKFSGHINLNYSVNSSDPLTQYRAINLINPTTDLSGDYSCVVMSSDNEDSKKKKMIVYAPPTKIEFNYTREVKEVPSALRKARGDSKEDGSVFPLFEEPYSSSYSSSSSSSSSSVSSTFSSSSSSTSKPSTSSPTLTTLPSSTGLLRCDIKGVYPMPEVSIYRLGDMNGTNPWPVTVVDTRIDEEKHPHSYNVRKVSLINDETLIKKFGLKPSIFECLVTLQLPNQKVVKRQKIMYTPVVKTIEPKGGEYKLNPNFRITMITTLLGILIRCT